MINLIKLLSESLDSPYRWKNEFETEEIDYEDEGTGEVYKKNVLSPVQIIRFKTDAGIPYLWYAKQNRYDGTIWDIAFGVEKGKGWKDAIELDIGVTKTGNARQVLSTVIEIINSFIEFDNDNYEIQRLHLTSKGDNRTNLYVKRIIPRIENFKLEHIDKSGNESDIMLIRTS